MLDRLEQMEQRYNELQSQFALPEVINDHEKYQKTAKSLREIEDPRREVSRTEAGTARESPMPAPCWPRAIADTARHGAGGDRRA